MNVAKNIIDQLGSKALFMLGAKDLAASNDGLSFKIRGSKSFTNITIKLNGSDLYDVTFYKVRAGKISREDINTDIYVDQLHKMIEQKTGLYTKL